MTHMQHNEGYGAACASGIRVLCGTVGGPVTTTGNVSQVTCPACKRVLYQIADDGVEERAAVDDWPGEPGGFPTLLGGTVHSTAHARVDPADGSIRPVWGAP